MVYFKQYQFRRLCRDPAATAPSYESPDQYHRSDSTPYLQCSPPSSPLYDTHIATRINIPKNYHFGYSFYRGQSITYWAICLDPHTGQTSTDGSTSVPRCRHSWKTVISRSWNSTEAIKSFIIGTGTEIVRHVRISQCHRGYQKPPTAERITAQRSIASRQWMTPLPERRLAWRFEMPSTALSDPEPSLVSLRHP